MLRGQIVYIFKTIGFQSSQFATEVHHINGNGEDAGVVYSEMQDHESEMENIVDVKLKELLFPPAHPYRVDTGGKLAFLRDSCSLQKVRKSERPQRNMRIFQPVFALIL